jgi:hypothetical protein
LGLTIVWLAVFPKADTKDAQVGMNKPESALGHHSQEQALEENCDKGGLIPSPALAAHGS